MKISILSFDLSDNATGRADLLARLLAPRWAVEVVGPRFGERVWRPVRDGAVSYRELPVDGARRYPRFAALWAELAARADGDVLYASKPRATSYGAALVARRRRRRPLLLDIDDWEVGFFRRSGAWGTLGRSLNLANPNGLPWTWLMERLVGRADAVTVASRFLERRFGGTLVPHVRDTEAWDPARYDRAEARARLGLGRERVVMFLGTPRAHKGVDDLVEAVGGMGGDVRLVLVGAGGGEASRRWAGQPWVRLVGEIPFDDVPRYLIAADVVAVPQRATSDTVGQVPAKVFDAMAMARPIVSTAVSMLPEILDGCGVLVPPGDVVALAAALKRLLDDASGAAELGRRARERCRAQYSFAAARAALFPLVERAVAGR
ncbi:MAG TPA: glycosyltransferase family 4 protein [Methylomirabilota bacterium]|nr:glycosyltransferase family 4 protein [Methylomirabilota bacterium]